MTKIKRREKDAVLQSLQAGLVPRQGLHLIQVGRKAELNAMLEDLDRISEQGSAFRIVVGRFGSGKSFFLNLVRSLALQKRMLAVQADMSMERRLYSSSGDAQALYSELVKNLSTKSKPEGGALRNVCEGWISSIHHEVIQAGGTEEDVGKRIFVDLQDLREMVGGFEFAQVLSKYYEGHVSGNDALQDAALRWLRGEYTTKTEAREALGVRRIISDESLYDSLKLLAEFSLKAGYGGLLVCLDELVVLSHRLPNARARQTNYEALLTILNDCLQGQVRGLGFILAGTDECLEDQRRGLFSYEALRSRLAGNTFAQEGLVDFSGPVVRLSALTAEDLFVLLKNVRHVHALGDEAAYAVPDEAIVAVLRKASESLGAEYFRTPRDIVRSFVGLLNVLDQNPGTQWEQIVGATEIEVSHDPNQSEPESEPDAASGDDLHSFRL